MEALTNIVGSEHVSQHADAIIIRPGSEDDVAAILRTCNDLKLVVTPSGGGTKLHWGNPVRAEVLLDLSRLSGVREHVWQDMTATVAAGTIWADLQTALAQHKQRVALDPLFPARSTVGGIVGTNDSGSLRAKYGSLRDLVIGATVVLADGTIARAGGKVVKNVAGYDLPKLMIGSFGTLGVVTEVSFRLHGLPPASSTWTARSADVAHLTALMQSIARAHLSLEAMQLRTEANAFALDIQLAALPEILAANEQQLSALSPPAALEQATTSVWKAREELFSDGDLKSTLLKITALPSRLPAIVAGIAQLNHGGELACTCVADPVGIVTASLRGPAPNIAAVIEDLRSRLLSTGGAVVILRSGSLDANLDRWGSPSSAIEVMRAIKSEFDPGRILNPGRFAGGI